MKTHAVPKDRLIEPQHKFPRPPLSQVRAGFAEIHEASESAYQGGGVWGKSILSPEYPPMYRNTAWRITGYCHALAVEGNDLLRTRVMEGAEYLVKEQQENGSFLWWAYETHGYPDSDHLLYCTSGPGVAFLAVYELTGDDRFLEASRRAADWAVGHGISPNNNYNSFAVWHLAEHYRATGEEKYLEHAVYGNREGAFARQLPNGAWAGHNAWIFYHAIIVRGFAALLGVLPDGHEAKPELQERTMAALNHLIEEQRANGHFRACFDPEEWEKSRAPKSAYSVHEPDIHGALALHALIYVQEWTDLDLSNALHGILGSPLPADLADQGMLQLAYGAGYRWLAQTT